MQELIHKRKWDSKIFDTGRTQLNIDGVTEDPIFASKLQNGMHDIEPNGSFIDCDEGVSEVTQGVTHLKMNRGRMGELRFGDSSHPNSFLVKIKKKNLKGVSFKYTGATGDSMTTNNGKPLCNFDNGISIESSPYYKGVRMDIIVNDPLTAPLEYPFSVKTYGQDYTFIEENGGATLRGEDQDPIFIKPPYAIDANGEIGSVTIHYTGMDGNLITFKKVVNETWLRNAVAPVRIDPNITIDDDTGTFEDAIAYNGAPNNNYGAWPQGTLINQAANKQSTFIKVLLTSLAGFTVTNAYFGFDVFGSTFPLVGNAHIILPTWGEGNKNGAAASAGELTYNSSEHSVALWNTANCKGDGTDRVAAVDGTYTFTAINSDTHFPVSNAAVQGMIDTPATNFGWVFETLNTVQTVAWRSSETVTGNKPYIFIEYTTGPAFNPSWARNSNQIIGSGVIT